MVTALVLEWSVADGAFGVSSVLGKHASSAELIPCRAAAFAWLSKNESLSPTRMTGHRDDGKTAFRGQAISFTRSPCCSISISISVGAVTNAR